MAGTLAESIVRKLIATSVVEEVDRELYVYGFFLLIAGSYFFFVTITLGCFLRIPLECIIFYVVFFSLRSYAGGIHAKSEAICTLLTTLALGLSLMAIKMLEISSKEMFSLLVVSDVCILFLSPIDNPGKPLDMEQLRNCRKKSLVFLIVYNMVIFVFSILRLKNFCCSVLYGISLEAILLSVGTLCGQHWNC